MAVWRTITRYLPSLILAFILAVAVWITAVTASDPVEERVYPGQVAVEVIGQDPGMVITSDKPAPVTVTLSAPRSIWNNTTSEPIVIRALADLSGLKAGKFDVAIHIEVGTRLTEVVSYTPRSFTITLEDLETRSLTIRVNRHGEPAVGFQAEAPTLSQATVAVSGRLTG